MAEVCVIAELQEIDRVSLNSTAPVLYVECTQPYTTCLITYPSNIPGLVTNLGLPQ